MPFLQGDAYLSPTVNAASTLSGAGHQARPDDCAEGSSARARREQRASCAIQARSEGHRCSESSQHRPSLLGRRGRRRPLHHDGVGRQFLRNAYRRAAVPGRNAGSTLSAVLKDEPRPSHDHCGGLGAKVRQDPVQTTMISRLVIRIAPLPFLGHDENPPQGSRSRMPPVYLTPAHTQRFSPTFPPKPAAPIRPTLSAREMPSNSPPRLRHRVFWPPGGKAVY